MENQKTISSLNSKVWYRLLKVIYCLFFVATLIIVNVVIHTASQEYKDTRLSKALSEYRSTLVQNTTNSLSTTNPFADLIPGDKAPCGIFCQMENENKIKDQQSKIITNYILAFFLVGNLILVTFFEVIKRCFYYIFFGSLRPKK